VTEQFELKLMFWDEARRQSEHRLFPSADAIDTAVARASGGIGLLQSLAAPIRAGCPGSGEEWMLLACFSAVVDADDEHKITAVTDISYDCASQVLLSTEAIQYLLAGLFAEVDPNIGGPEISSVTFRQIGDTIYQFALALTACVDDASLDDDEPNFALRRLTSKGWQGPGSQAISVTYAEAINSARDQTIAGPAIYITVDESREAPFLVAGARYQLFTPRAADPVVDHNLRGLRPRDFIWRFGLAKDSGSGGLVATSLPAEPCRGEAAA
jgi:hypothetical protein